jgi:hypothetical protein
MYVCMCVVCTFHVGLTIGIGKVLTHQEDTSPPKIPGCKFSGKKV